MNKYPVLRSTLEGIFGSSVGLNDEDAILSLLRDLTHKPFRDALQIEVSAAFVDTDISWRLLLEECEVAYFESDVEAKRFVIERIANRFCQLNNGELRLFH